MKSSIVIHKGRQVIDPSSAEALELVLLSLAGERFAIQAEHVLDVAPLRGLRPVAETPPFIVGVMNHGDRALPIIDLQSLAGLEGWRIRDECQILVVEARGVTFGVLADAVPGILLVGSHDVAPVPAALRGGCRAFRRGTIREMVTVLDPNALALLPQVSGHAAEASSANGPETPSFAVAGAAV